MPAHQSALNSFSCIRGLKAKTHMLMDIKKSSSLGLGICINSCLFKKKKSTIYVFQSRKTVCRKTVLLFEPIFHIQKGSNRRTESILTPVRVLVSPLPSVPTCNSQLLINNSYQKSSIQTCERWHRVAKQIIYTVTYLIATVRMLNCFCVSLISIVFSICNCKRHKCFTIWFMCLACDIKSHGLQMSCN